MAISITTAPDTYHLSGNPVIFEFTTNTRQDFHFIGFHLMSKDNEVEPPTETEFANVLIPVVSGKASVDISDYLKQLFTGHFEFDDNEHHHDILINYYLSYYEIYNNDVTEQNSGDSSDYYVVQGKLDYKNLAVLTGLSSSFFKKYYTDNAPLTLRTEKKYVRDCEDDILYLIASRESYNINISFKIIGESSYTNSMIEYFNIDVADRGKIFEIPIGWNNFIANKISSKLWKDSVFAYQIYLQYDTGEMYNLILHSEYILKYNTDEYNAVIFKNILGVYEKIYFYGVRSDETSYDRTMSYYDENDILISSSIKKSFTLNTGWISEGEYENMLLLLNSKDTYIEEDDLNIPVVVIQSKTDKRSSRNHMYSLEVEFQYAFTDNL